MSILEDLAGVVDDFSIPDGVIVERQDHTSVDAFGDPRQGIVRRMRVCPAVVQPLTPRERVMLQEGDQTREGILVHTKKPLRTSLEARGQKADVVVYEPGGDQEAMRYHVTVAGDWQIVAGFHACIALKEELD